MEKAVHLQHLADIEREKDIYNIKLFEIRSKCADLRAGIDKLMKSRRDMTKLKEIISSAKPTINTPPVDHKQRRATSVLSMRSMNAEGAVVGANGSQTHDFLRREASLVNMGSGSCVTIVHPGGSIKILEKSDENGATPSGIGIDKKHEIANVRSDICQRHSPSLDNL